MKTHTNDYKNIVKGLKTNKKTNEIQQRNTKSRS